MLDKHGHRYNAFPFDWLFSSLEVIEHCIRTHFRDFLNVGYLYDIRGESARHTIYNPMINTPNLWGHYLEHGGDPEVSREEAAWKFFNHHDLRVPDTYEAFTRRCERFRALLEGDEDVSLVYMNRNTNNCEEIVSFARRMAFRDGIWVVGIIEDATAAATGLEVLAAEKGVLVVRTVSPDAYFPLIDELVEKLRAYSA